MRNERMRVCASEYEASLVSFGNDSQGQLELGTLHGASAPARGG